MNAAPPHGPTGPAEPGAEGGLIIALGRLEPHHIPQAGAKAVALGRMLQAGLPVPPGFVVTVQAFNSFLASDPEHPVFPSDPPAGPTVSATRSSSEPDPASDPTPGRITRGEAGLAHAPEPNPVNRTAIELESRRILDALDRRPFPKGVAEAIHSALNLHPNTEQWAVRSSATAEDTVHASFAGQHDTFLNVSRAEITARVRDCWRSLFQPRALIYRAQQGIPWDQAAMAVILQEMVAAECAGVIFTLDPLTHDPSRLVIEGARGLGDQLVGGRITPDRVVLARDSLAVLERNPGAESRDHSPGPAPSDDEPAPHQTVGGAMQIEDRLAHALAELSQRVEGIFPGPLDIEWATRGREIFLLQARPITSRPRVRAGQAACSIRTCAPTVNPSTGGARLRRALPSCPSEKSELDRVSPHPGSRPERQVWTNLNTGEVMPDVMTPVTWSMIRLFLAPLFRSVFRLHGADIARSPLVGLVAGRLYFNANTGLAAMRPFSFLVRRIPHIARALGGGPFAPSGQEGLKVPDADLPDLGFRWPKYILSWPGILIDLLRHAPWRAEGWIARLKTRTDVLAAQDIDSMPTADLAALFARQQGEAYDSWDLLYLITQAFALPLFQKACQDWLDDPDLSLGYRLFSALGGLPEAEAGLDLWRLAALAHSDRDTAASVLCAGEWTLVRTNLERTEAGRTWLQAWEEFRREHGHHCRGEIELFNARWAETPDYILSLVRSYLRAIDQSHPVEKQKQLAGERRRLTEHCRQRLKNPVQRWIFTFSLRRAQTLARHREEWKNQAVRQIAVLRRALLTLGSRLHQNGVLADRDDVFFLEIPEIVATATGPAHPDLRDWVASRRKEYERNRKLHPPPVVIGEFTPTAPDSPIPDVGTRLLKGIPVSPSAVSGRAKVILRSDEDEQVLPGEILIAPFTDPAWTPYFVQAAGLVADQGGILSHGSIVAREYGLPAVTNVGSATRLIHTGDLVHVDGNRGEVTILERAAKE